MLVTFSLPTMGRTSPGRAIFHVCSVLLASMLACRTGPVVSDEGEEEPPPPPPAPAAVALAPGVVLDMGADNSPQYVVDGFSLPEAVGSRRASWSEGEVATVAFPLLGGARSYQVTFLGEPYHELGELAVGVALNRKPAGEAKVSRGWRAYRIIVPGEKVIQGRNELSFHFSKTGRPSDYNAQSNDLRELGVRFEQIQVQPITSEVNLAFGGKNPLGLAALGDGWALDPNDRGTGTWTLGERSVITFAIDRSGVTNFRLMLDARVPRGAAERSARVSLNGAPLGELIFEDTKSTRELDIPAEQLRAENELVLELGHVVPHSEVDTKSKDTRPLGIRVFQLGVRPKEAARNVVSGELSLTPARP
jgi:hypothetical protein